MFLWQGQPTARDALLLIICSIVTAFTMAVRGHPFVGIFAGIGSVGANEKQLKAHGTRYEKVYVHAADHASYYPGQQ